MGRVVSFSLHALSPVRRSVHMNLFWAIFVVILTTGVSPAVSADVPVARLTPEQCRNYFSGITKDLNDDLALVPYVERSLTEIYGVLNVKGLTDAQIVANLSTAETRNFAFEIEGIGGALEAVDKRRFKEIFSEGQILENVIGDYSFSTELQEFIHRPDLARLLTPRIEAYFEGRAMEARKTVLETIRRRGWIPSGQKNAYREILRNLEGGDAITKKSYLKKKLLEWMAESFEKTHRDIVSGRLDPKNIEFGVHKLRREIRKIAIVALSFEGMFYLEDGLKISGITVSDAARSATKFLPKEDHLLKRAVGISRDGFLYIGEIISELGDLKSNDGMKEYVFKELAESDLGAEIQPLLDAVDPKRASAASFRTTRARAKKIFEDITIRTDFLNQMAKQFRQAAREF